MKLKIITVATAILLLVAMSVPVYADTTLPAPPSGAFEYWVYFTQGPILYLGTGHTPITVGDEEGTGIILHEGGKVYIYQNNKWVIKYTNMDAIYNSGFVIIAANHDIAYDDGSGFFFLRPKVPPLYQTMKETDFGTILRNFSAGLIPLIGCLILGLSLVKAWGFLRTQLKH